MNDPVLLSWTDVMSLPIEGTVVWASRSILEKVRSALPFSTIDSSNTPFQGIPRVIVIGGGGLIDKAKLWRAEISPTSWLMAIPSIWGSGAESSAIAVRTENGRKVPHVSNDLLPNARAVWPDLAEQLPENLARWGYGDVWSHAIEGFLSPLANDALRKDAATFLQNFLLPQPFVKSPEWFELSAIACALQARSGVGLIHGIAHELEPFSPEFGHAHLCSIFLWPVLTFNVSRSDKVGTLCNMYGVDLTAILARVSELHDSVGYDSLIPLLKDNWNQIIRNPLSRINCVLARPDSLNWFANKEFAI